MATHDTKMNPLLCETRGIKSTNGIKLVCAGCDPRRKWAFEKLLYANCDYGWKPEESRKYAVQPQRVWATGVHYSEHMKLGKREDMDITTLRAYHYHNTVNSRTELCRAFPHTPNGEPNSLNVRNCTVDLSMANLAPTIKRYELAVVGKQPFIL